MHDQSEDPGTGAELDKALAELLEQTRKEAISPRLRELAEQLAKAIGKGCT
jgi:hypothetical protein